jgi:hypothetical protein
MANPNQEVKYTKVNFSLGGVMSQKKEAEEGENE